LKRTGKRRNYIMNNVAEQFMKAVFKNSQSVNESYRKSLKDILEIFIRDRKACTDKFKNVKRKTSRFSLCAAYILCEDKELEKEWKDIFEYFIDYLSYEYLKDVEKELKLDLIKDDVINSNNLNFDEYSDIHNIIQTVFLCSICSEYRIAEIGKSLNKLFINQDPIKTLNIISKLYRVKGSYKFLKGQLDKFTNDLRLIEVPEKYIISWILGYGQDYKLCDDEVKSIYEKYIKKHSEMNIIDFNEVCEVLNRIDSKEQMKIYRDFLETYESVEFQDKIDVVKNNIEAISTDIPAEVLKRALKKFSKEALVMKLSQGEDVNRWATKLGGKPYLPIGEEYPAEGMKLLAQINFEEIPKMKGYPDKGLIQFYVVVDESDNWDDYSIRYFSEIIKDESKLQNELPEMSYDDCDPILKGEVKVSCTKVEQTPAWHDYLLQGEIREILDEMYSDEDEESDVLQEYEESRRINKHNSIGGYPCFTEEDPREYDVITALPGMEYGEVFGEVSYENEWVCLLALYDSELGDFGKLLYEEGSIHFFIRRVDLEKGDFSDIKYSRFTY